MTVNIEVEASPGFSFHYKKLAERVIGAAIELEDFPYEAEVDLILTDNAGIREINAQFRQIDRATDVLSFPMLSYKAPGDFSDLDAAAQECCNPDTREVLLGDIVISSEKVRGQAAEYGHSEKREYAFLIVHSMLHLFGYDHMEPVGREEMEAHQRRILDYLKIYR